MGATGAVGTATVKHLLQFGDLQSLTLLGRRPFTAFDDPRIAQHIVDVEEPDSYRDLLPGHACAICTLGIGEPSKASRETFLRIDRDAVLAFGEAAAETGVRHFQLLSSVGSDAKSPSFFLRSKGKLEDGLRALRFKRLSLFHPSMILTPTNRYGFSQAVTLAVWPKLSPVLRGPLGKLRGIKVDDLGAAIANNAALAGSGSEVLEVPEIEALAQ